MSMSYSDENGNAIPESEVELYTFLVEFPFDVEDPDYDAFEWDDWTDADVWALGPEPEPFEPSCEDREWLNRQDAVSCESDWDEYARIAEMQDRMEAVRHMDHLTDQDVIVVTGCAG
jgi:hypothetical protein